MVLSYDWALSWTCIPEYKLILKKKKKKQASSTLPTWAQASPDLWEFIQYAFARGMD
jgi:hypothetical protein